MRNLDMPHEVFRRSWLTLTLEWSLAGSVSLAVGLVAQYFDFQEGWVGAGLIALPIAWAIGQTIQWAFQTWTVTTDGRLIIQSGVLFRTSQDIRLRSVQRVTIETPSLSGWLDIGHISCTAIGPLDQSQSFRWTWLRRHRRLVDLIQARGQLAVGRQPSRRQFAISPTRRLGHAVGAGLMPGRYLIEEGIARLRGQWVVDDYGRFLGFCHLLLRSRGNGHWPPPRISPVVAHYWMRVLRRTQVLLVSPDGAWRVDSAIHTVEDVRRRVSEDELRRAIR